MPTEAEMREQLAVILGRRAEDITPEQLKAFEQDMAAESAEPTATEEDSITATVQKPAEATEEKPPDEPLYSLKDPVKLREALKANPDLFKEVVGDPIHDVDNPLHKPFADTKKWGDAEHQERLRLESTLGEVIARIGAQADPTKDDPAKGMYGGMTAEMVDDPDSDVTFAQYQEAERNYNNAQAARAEHSRLMREESDRLNREETEFKVAHPDANTDAIYDRFSVTTKDGKPNPNYKGLTLAEAHLLLTHDPARIEAQIKAEGDKRFEEGKKFVLSELAKHTPQKNITSLSSAGTLTSGEVHDAQMPTGDPSTWTPEQDRAYLDAIGARSRNNQFKSFVSTG